MALSNENKTTLSKAVGPHYDITEKLSSFMDLHFLFHLIDFLTNMDIYEEKSLLEAKLELLQPTNMVDFASEIYQKIHSTGKMPNHLEKRRNEILLELNRTKEQCQKILTLLSNADEMKKLEDGKLFSLPYLTEQYGITYETLTVFYQYAKLQYECGNYQAPLLYLQFYCTVLETSCNTLFSSSALHENTTPSLIHVLTSSSNNSSHLIQAIFQSIDRDVCLEMKKYLQLYMDALWGKLACEILMFKWEDALQDIDKLFNLIHMKGIPHTGSVLPSGAAGSSAGTELATEAATTTSSPNSFLSSQEQVQQYTWLLHWSLFLFGWYKEKRDAIIDFMFLPSSLHIIQTQAPWLVRYLIAGIFLHSSKTRKHVLVKDMTSFLTNKEFQQLNDPFVGLFQAIFIEYKFDELDVWIPEILKLGSSDFFFHEYNTSDLLPNLRQLVFENYCQLYSKVSIEKLAQKLCLFSKNNEKYKYNAELEIVELLRKSPIVGKIDSENGYLMIERVKRSVHEDIIEKTKHLTIRTLNLIKYVDHGKKSRRG